MSLSFDKNTANHVDLGIAALDGLSGASAISVAAWVRQRSMTTGPTDNGILRAILDGTLDGIFFGLVGLQDLSKVRLSVRSNNTDAPQAISGATTISQNTWIHVGAVFDVGNRLLRAYYNGSPDGTFVPALNATTYTTGTQTAQDTIGGSSSSSPNFGLNSDADIGEVAIWKGDIGDDGFFELGKGFSPLLVRPNLLFEYWRMVGPEGVKGLRRGINGTITGSIPPSSTDPTHPRILRRD